MAAGAESSFAHERVWAVEAVGQCEFMAAGAESSFAHERVWAVEAVGQCEFMAVVDRDRGSVRNQWEIQLAISPTAQKPPDPTTLVKSK